MHGLRTKEELGSQVWCNTFAPSSTSSPFSVVFRVLYVTLDDGKYW